MAVLLVLGFIEWIEQPDYGVVDMIGLFAQQLGIGSRDRGRGRLPARSTPSAAPSSTTAGLYPVASLATAGLAFGAADTLHGSGFLAVYLAGLIARHGERSRPSARSSTFHQGLAWVAQIAMFLALGLLVFPSELGDVWLEGTVLALVLVFVARPVATFIGTALDRFSLPRAVLLGWAGLRGAVPVVLATFPVIEGVPHSGEFFNIVFFAVRDLDAAPGRDLRAAGQAPRADDEPARRCRSPLAEAGTIRRLGAEVLEYPVGEATRSSARACATSGCRARRSST